MPRPRSLDIMSLDDLIELREAITAKLKERIAKLHLDFSGPNGTDAGGRKNVQPREPDVGPRRRTATKAGRSSSLKGRKVEPKYRSKKEPTLTWAGRGVMPRWLRDEMKEGRLHKEAFLIDGGSGLD